MLHFLRIPLLVFVLVVYHNYGGLTQHIVIISWFLWVGSPCMALPGSLIRVLPGGCSQGVGWACSLTARVEEGEGSAGSSCSVGHSSVQHVGLSAQVLAGCWPKATLSSLQCGCLHQAAPNMAGCFFTARTGVFQ